MQLVMEGSCLTGGKAPARRRSKERDEQPRKHRTRLEHSVCLFLLLLLLLAHGSFDQEPTCFQQGRRCSFMCELYDAQGGVLVIEAVNRSQVEGDLLCASDICRICRQVYVRAKEEESLL